MKNKMSEDRKKLSLEERSKKFLDITLRINEISEEYNEIDPIVGYRFQGMFRTFISLMKRAEEKDMTNLESQIKVFEEMFDFSFEEEVEKRVKEVLGDEYHRNVQEDINKIDDEVLANIKKNISEYLKE